MFSIYDGRDSFYQWDLDRKLIVEDSSIKEVHFCNKTDDCSLVVETYEENGKTLANVPNILLTSSWKIRVFGYTGDFTKYEECFKVNARSKPADYKYIETETKSNEEIIAMLDSMGDITEATYLFPKVTATFENSYVKKDGDGEEQENCTEYQYSLNHTNTKIADRYLTIKTYMYGDMAIYINYGYWGKKPVGITNEKADIVANPESGIFEYKVKVPNDVYYEDTDIYVSFCENPYMEKPEVYVDTNLWEEMNYKLSNGDLEELWEFVNGNCIDWGVIDDLYSQGEDLYIITNDLDSRVSELEENGGGSGGADYSEDIENLTDFIESHSQNEDNPHNVMYEQIYDAHGMDIYDRTNYQIADYLTLYFDKNGVHQNLIETSRKNVGEFRVYKTITLSQQTQTKYFPFSMEACGECTMLYFQANVISDTDYNTRVVNYTLDYNEEDDVTWGININLASDIPQGQTAKVTIAAHFYLDGGF